MTIDKIAWIHLENGAILSSRSRGKDVYYIPGGKREPGEVTSTLSSARSRKNSA